MFVSVCVCKCTEKASKGAMAKEDLVYSYHKIVILLEKNAITLIV